MQAGQTKNGIGMTLSACLWLGLFPLMQFGTFSSITRDKWICMYILTGVSLLCFLVDLCCRRLSRPRVFPLVTGALLGVAHLVLRPVLRILCAPLGCLTLGLFGMVIDVGLIYTCDHLVDGFAVPGLLYAVLTAVLINAICAVAAGRK